jgi:hypothetical protein
MRKPQGYALETDNFTHLTVREQDTFTCNHCGRVTHVKPFCDPADLGGHCKMCDKLICKKCAYLASLGKPCATLEKKLDRMEKHLAAGGAFRDVLTFGDD